MTKSKPPPTKKKSSSSSPSPVFITKHVLVVGGGIAGLETVRQLQELSSVSTQVEYRITLLEHKPYFGGRIQTVRTSSPTHFYEAGASRIACTHTLVGNLVRLLGLARLPYPAHEAATQRALICQYRSLRRAFVSKYDEAMLKNVTWSDVLHDVCDTECEATTLMSQWGFTAMQCNMNAHDFWKHAIPHYCAKKYYSLEGGLQSLPDALSARVLREGGGVEAHLQATLRTLREATDGGQRYHVTWDTSTSSSSSSLSTSSRHFDAVVLAMPAEALAAVAGLPAELTRRLDTVSRNPLLRCYVKLVDSASARPPNYAAATQTVLRRALPTADPRWVQVSYTDHIPAERLYNLLTNVHGRAVLQAHAAPIVAPDAWTELDLHFWKAGTHSWRPKQTADCHYEHVLQPDPTAPLFVVGACFSHAQHWIEGALETAGDAVRALRRLWRVSSRPATRRTMKASATCPVQRVPLRAWAMDDVVAHGHVVYANKVYDISEIAPLHPGGAKILTNARGTDVTRAFHGVGHSVTAKAWLDQHCVGTLSPST